MRNRVMCWRVLLQLNQVLHKRRENALTISGVMPTFRSHVEVRVLVVQLITINSGEVEATSSQNHLKGFSLLEMTGTVFGRILAAGAVTV